MTATPAPGWSAVGPKEANESLAGASGKAGSTGSGAGVAPEIGISSKPAAAALRSAISAGAGDGTGRKADATGPAATEERSPKSLKTLLNRSLQPRAA